jgi:hypothetical protein
MSAHTPGPWYIAHHSDVQGEKSIDVRHCLDSAPKQPEIHQIARLHEADEANARLIAAAPEMLDALQAVCDAYGERDTLLMAQVKAALAKAKGGVA